jgi:hypothetical protein
MANTNPGRRWLCAVASVALLAVSTAIAPPAGAQDTGIQISGDAAKTIDLNSAPKVAAAPRPEGLSINRPTIPMADYVAAKNAAAAHAPSGARPSAAPPSSTNVSVYAQSRSTNQTQSCCFPPDGDIATSAYWMVQINNDVITMLDRGTNTFVQEKLSTLFNDNSSFIFDSRVIWDPYWDRFVVLADACTNCGDITSNVSIFELAVSMGGDPRSWWIYRFGPGTATGDFADFPQLGMDLNSIILTYNDFKANNTFDARTAAIGKAYVYNGHGFSVPLFGGSGCTMAPPYVLDNSGVDYVMTICPGGNIVWIASLTNSGLSNANLNLWDNAVGIDYFGVPPSANQSGTTYTLDTGDNRFENRSLQVGSRILNVATVNTGGSPTPAWYNFDIGVSPHTLVADGEWFRSGTSNDWHPAINANTSRHPPAPRAGRFSGPG